MKNKKMVSIILVCILVAGLSFWAGTAYGKGKNITSNFSRQGMFNQNSTNQNGIARMGRGNTGGGFVSGTVLSKDANSITVQLRGPDMMNAQSGATTTGGSKIVIYSTSTGIEKTVSGAIGDVVVGSQVSVTGTANPDGSVNATSIQIRPTQANKQ